MPQATRILKWLGVGLGGLLVVVAAGLALGYAWLRSDGGGDWLARQIEQAVSSPGELQLTIGRLEGDLPAELRLRDIRLSDAEGQWLTIAGLDVDWQPWDLLDRVLQIDALALSGVELARLPVAPAEAQEAAASEEDDGGLPSLPLRVRISRLSADEIALGEPVLGQAARFTLAGEASGREDGRLSAGLELRRLDAAEARLLATLDYDPSSDILTADVDAAEAAGGLLATLLDLPDLPRAELRLTGSGPLSAWAGDFALSLGDVARAEAAIGIERDAVGDLGFRLDGYGDINPPAGEPIWDLLRGRTEVTLAGRWQEDRRLQLQRLTASGAALTLETAGSYEPETGSLDMTLKATTGDTSLLAGLLDLDRLDGLAVEVAASGTLERPEARIALQVDGIAVPEFEAVAVNLTGRVAAANDLMGPAPRLDLDLTGQLDAPLLVGADQVNAVLGPTLPWKLQGSLALDSLALEIAALEAQLAAASLAASGPFDLQNGAAQLQARLDVADLTRLQPLTDIELGGRATLAGPVTLTDFGSRLEGELAGGWEQPSSDIGLLAVAAGQGMDVSLRLAVDGATVHLRDLKARSQVAELSGALTVRPNPTALDGRYTVALPDAAVLAWELATDLSGPARIEGEILGPVDLLQLSGRLQVQQLTIEEQVLRDLSGTYRLELRGADIDGPVTLALLSRFGPAEAQGDLKVRKTSVTLSALQAKLGQTTVRGEVIAPLDGAAPIVVLDGEIGDLKPWLDVAGLGGGGRGNVSLKLNTPGAAAPVLASADLSAVSVVPEPGGAPVAATRLTLSLLAQDPVLEQPASFKLRGEGVRRDDLKLDRLDLDGQGSLQDLTLTLATAGSWVEPLELKAAARLRQTGETLAVTLREAEGRAFGQPLSLRQAAELTLAPAETRLENLDLASGGTRLTANARLGGDQVAVTAALDALPMTTVDAFWQSGLSGMLSAKLDLQGPVDDPRGTASLTATGLRPRDAKKIPELELKSSADWQGGRVRLEGQLGGAQVTAARFSAEAPLRLTPDGGGLEVPDDGALAGQVSWSGDIATMLLFVPLPQHRIKGQTDIALDITGTVGAPKLDGRITVSEGRYENLDSGTVLRQLNLTAEVAEDRVTLTRLDASDGAKGKLNGQGSLLIDPEKAFPFDVAIALEQFRALERDEVTAILSGTVKVEGSAEAPRVEGRFTTDIVEVSLATNLPPDVVSLDVIEIKDGVVQTTPEEAKAAPPVDAELDVIIDMPRRIFVRGRGLDSEWAGRISVQGTAAKPQISGEVNLVRGQMSVVGKTFKLDEGQVTLPAAADSDPLLDVTAIHKGKDLVVTARLSGPVTKPEMELTSVPEVPRDEIISRVLFGKSAAQLSAGEAAQLALALRDLTGSGGGTDILGFARRAMGVDVLRVDTTAEGDAAVEAGKYLTDEVYVGVKQGATSQSMGAEVEVELTPNITVESEVTGSGANKSGVRFQLDY